MHQFHKQSPRYRESKSVQLQAREAKVPIAKRCEPVVVPVGAPTILVMTCIAESVTDTKANSATGVV
jgi:hypothetical protein